MVRQPAGSLALLMMLLGGCGHSPPSPSDCTEEEAMASHWRWEDADEEGCIDPITPLALVCDDDSLMGNTRCPTSFDGLLSELREDPSGYCSPSVYQCLDATDDVIADIIADQHCSTAGRTVWMYWFSHDDGSLLAMRRGDYYLPSQPEPPFCCAGRRTRSLTWGDWSMDFRCVSTNRPM